MKWFTIALFASTSAVLRGIDSSDEGDDGTGQHSTGRGVEVLGVCRVEVQSFASRTEVQAGFGSHVSWAQRLIHNRESSVRDGTNISPCCAASAICMVNTHLWIATQRNCQRQYHL